MRMCWGLKWSNVALMGLAVLLGITAKAQDPNVAAVKERYAATLAAMQNMKTPADLRRMFDETDAPEWVSIDPNGETMTRDQAMKGVESILSIPPGSRPIPIQDFVYMATTGKEVIAVYWVYRRTDSGLVGSMVRDTWAHRDTGWRRTKHEKFFPDRPLTDHGNPVILPAGSSQK